MPQGLEVQILSRALYRFNSAKGGIKSVWLRGIELTVTVAKIPAKISFSAIMKNQRGLLPGGENPLPRTINNYSCAVGIIIDRTARWVELVIAVDGKQMSYFSAVNGIPIGLLPGGENPLPRTHPRQGFGMASVHLSIALD